MNRINSFIVFGLMAGVLANASLVAHLSGDELTIFRNEKETRLEGKVVGEAEDKSVLFQTRDGKLWIIEGDEIRSKTKDDKPLSPLTTKQLGRQLLDELPDGFKIHDAGSFVIAYNTERAYARWIGGLYSRLSRGFLSYWQKKRFKLEKPELPLAVVIFASKAEYDRYQANEIGRVQPGMVAYYNLLSNRVAMYDLTQGRRPAGSDLGNDRRIAEILSNPQAIPMVATVIHEGTHQLMFNSGMQVRFSDTPLWVNEGIAMFFEAPDLKNNRGWRAIGKLNPLRLNGFRQTMNQRQPDSLKKMLSSSDKFRDPSTALEAYAEAWAFNYFLLNKHSKEYVEYLKFMSRKPVLDYDEPAQRIKDFARFFDVDLGTLEQEFLKFIRDIR